MEKKRALKNVFISILFKILVIISGILATRYLIQYLGNDANGLNSLFTSIVGVLAVAELGVGTAITYCMYKPISEKDENTVVGLYCLFKKLYLGIAGIIFVVGLCVLPALPYLAKDYQLDFNIYLCFFLMLVSTVLTYLFSSKISLINAYKNNYITTTINSVGLIIQSAIQIVVILCFKSLYLFFAARILATLIQWGLTVIITRKMHKDIITKKAILNAEVKKELTKNIKALFMHKIGTLLVNTADSIIISAFISVAILGKYTNYVTIVTAMISVITLFITPLTSMIGHIFVQDLDRTKKYFNFFHAIIFIIGCVFFLGYYAICDELIQILFGHDLELERSIVIVITINYFIQYLRQTVVTFKDATGVFYSDRFRPLVEGIINIILSIALVNVIGVVGVIVSTIVTNLFICHTVEPWVLYKDAFKETPKRYYITNYLYILLFVGLLFAFHFTVRGIHMDNVWLSLLVRGSISVGFSFVPAGIVVLTNRDFREHILRFLKH